MSWTKYIIYNKVTGEVYAECYNSYAAMSNTVHYRNKYGADVVCKVYEQFNKN